MANAPNSPLAKVFDAPDPGDAMWCDDARRLGVSTISAALGEPFGRQVLMQPGRLARISGTGVVAGYAVTVWNPPGNNTMIRFGIEAIRPGDVLVVSSATDEAAQIGDLACQWAQARGAAGIVVDGAVRDIETIRDMGMSVWGRSIDPRQALKEALGYVNAPVAVAGVRVAAGDLIVADDDGIVVLPPTSLDVALARARARQEAELVIREEAQTGETPAALADIFSSEQIDFVGRPWSQEDDG